jgi:hypothetical protein
MDAQLRTGLEARLSDLKQRKGGALQSIEKLEKEIVQLDVEIAPLEQILQAANGNAPTPSSPAVALSQSNNVRLSELQAPGTNDPPPISITFPNGDIRRLGRWNRLLIEVAKYLDSQGRLAALQLPLRVPHGTRHVLSRTPVHHNGRPFFQPIQLDSGIYLETHANATNLFNQTKLLLLEVGEGLDLYTITA